MIRSEREYQEALHRFTRDEQFLEAEREALLARGLAPEEIEKALEPAVSFHLQLRDELDWYERVQRGDFDALQNLVGLGQLLIALRISKGITQKELAERLGVSEAQVSRDERNEYHGITVERASRILTALGARLTTQVVQEPVPMASA
jgi:DNA-binding Xre family transcriptional regulator